ncbi:MAG: hypothetical protein IT181_12720, partial [Acidobacteria bacterium]|nr:hypothetical protein [Acidobacteriota bacterium]
MRNLALAVVIVWLAVSLQAQPGGTAPVLYEGARLIIGDTSPPIAAGALLVHDGQIRAVGAVGTVTAAAGVRRVDLTGKTVMPAMVKAHVHMGYEKYNNWNFA